MITALTSLRRILRLLAVLTAFLAAPAGTFSQSQDQILRTIIEKTREREALLDNFDWRLKRTSGDASRPEGVITEETRCVKSGKRWLYDCKRWGSAKPQKIQTDLVACDGDVARTLHDYGLSSGKHGRIERGGGSYQEFGVQLGLNLPGMRLKLSDMLEGEREEPTPLDDPRSSRGVSIPKSLEILPPEERTVAGRACYTVSFIEKEWHTGELYRVTRASFAPDLEFACVGIEQDTYDSGTVRRTLAYNLSDFREAKDGLFLPFQWTTTHFDKGVQSWASEAETVSFESRTTFDDSLFTFSFPKGTLVQDNLLGDTYIVGEAVPGEVSEKVIEEMRNETLADLKPLDEPEGPLGAEADGAKAVSAATDVATAQESARGPEAGTNAPVESVRGFVPVGLALVVLVILAAALALAAALRRRGRSA